MKRSAVRGQGSHGPQDSGQQGVQQPEKVGWIRKFYGHGIFRELWRNRYVVLRGEHLYICDKEVKDEWSAQEVFDLSDYERSDELRKVKSRNKKNHSRFTVLRRRHGNTEKQQVPNLLFLAVSPEEKESWVNALNMAIIKAKNRVLDEVTTEEDGVLVHPTRDRAKIPPGRRLPSRGHLMGSSSLHGMLTLDLVTEEDHDSHPQESLENSSCVVGGRQRAGTDVSKLRATSREPRMKTGSLPRGSERSWGKQDLLRIPQTQVLQAHSLTPQPGKRSSVQGRSRCASMDQVLSSRPTMIRSELRSALRRCPTEDEAVGGASVQPLQSLIAQRMQRAQELLEEMRLQELQKAKAEKEREDRCLYLNGMESPRLHHLRGSDSPNSSRSSGSPRSSDSPRLRAKDSPRLRGRESPRSRAKRNRSKGHDSPRSKGANSPQYKGAKSPQSIGANSPQSQTKELPHLNAAVSLPTNSLQSHKAKVSSETSQSHQEVDSPIHESPESPPCVRGLDPLKVKGSDSPRSSETNSLGPSESLHSPQLKPRLSPPAASFSSTEEMELEQRRAETERLLEEAVSSWKEAQEVLQEVKELQSQTLRRQRRKTYEKMTSAAAAAGFPTATEAAEEEDTPTSPTLPEDNESGTT